MSEEILCALTFPVHEGVQIDRYRILGKLGAGGMGVVFKAFDLELKRHVAIKFMYKQGEGSQGASRFAREIEATARLAHPNIVKVFHFGQFQTYPYFVMEYVAGFPLHKYCEQKQTSLTDRVALVEKVALALAHAHSSGVIHRDVKPSNIMVRENGEPVLMDFGLAKVSKLDNRTITRTGEVIGTPEYMPPEQARGLKRESDAQSDIYGLGAVLYHMLTGVPPVQGDNLVEKIRKIVDTEPVPPSQLVPGVPTALEKVCRKAMEKKKRRRYKSATRMAADITAYRHGKTTSAEWFYRRRLAAQCISLLLALCVLAAGTWQMWRFLSQPAVPKISYVQELRAMYEKAREKLQISPQEAYFYFDHIASLCNQQQKCTDTHDDKTLAEMRRQLRHDILQAAFAAGDYQATYRLGKEWANNGQSDVSLHELWMVAKSAYHSGSLADAVARMQAVSAVAEHNSRQTPDDAELRTMLAEIAYYQGIGWFHRQRLGEARTHLEKALSSLPPGNERLRQLICLYFCAILLADLTASLNEADNALLARLWPVVEDGRKWLGGQGRAIFLLCEETAARQYLYQAIRASSPQERSRLASQVVGIVDQLLSEDTPRGIWHYMRGKAEILAGQYQQAADDLEMSLRLEPAYLAPLNDKLELLWLHPQVQNVRDCLVSLHNYLRRGTRPESPAFAQKFALLRQQYQEYRAQTTGGLIFSDRSFAQYFQQYQEKSEAVRTLARSALCSMLPHADVRQALHKKIGAGHPQERAWCQEIISLLDKKEQQEMEREFLHMLVHVPFRGRAWRAPAFYPRYLPLLYRTLDDSPNLYLRFLAAKVLAHLPVPDIRRQLCDKYLGREDSPPKQSAINTVLVCKALSEIGYQYSLLHSQLLPQWTQQLAGNKEWLSPCTREEEDFVLALLAESLPAIPLASLPIIERLLQHPGVMVRLAALSRLPMEKDFAQQHPQIYQNVKQTVEQTLADKSDEDAQAILLCTLAQYLGARIKETSMGWIGLAKECLYAPPTIDHLLQLVSSPRPHLQQAALYFWREMSALEAYLPAELFDRVRQAVRPLWQEADPMIRYQAIRTSAQLWDQQVMETIGFDKNKPLMERLFALFSGFQKYSKQRHQAKARSMWYLQQVEKRKLVHDHNWVVPGIMVFILAREGKGFMSDMTLCGLDSDNPRIRFCTTMSMAYMHSLSDAWQRRLQHIADSDPTPYVRPVAWGVLLHLAQRGKKEKIDNLHRQIKDYHETDWQDYRLAAAWGYGMKWELSDFDQSMWEQELLEFQRQEEFVNQLDNETVQEVETRLLLCRDMLQEVPEHECYRECIYWTALLAEKKGDYLEALSIAEQLRQLPGEQDGRFAEMWSRLLVRQGKNESVREEIRKRLHACAGFPERLPSGLHCPAAAMWTRLAYQMAQLDHSDDRQHLVYEQHMLDPQHPMSLLLIGDYALASKDYHTSECIFVERSVQPVLARNARFFLARVYAQKGDQGKALYYLKLWWRAKTPPPPQQLVGYPELLALIALPDFKKMWR